MTSWAYRLGGHLILVVVQPKPRSLLHVATAFRLAHRTRARVARADGALLSAEALTETLAAEELVSELEAILDGPGMTVLGDTSECLRWPECGVWACPESSRDRQEVVRRARSA